MTIKEQSTLNYILGRFEGIAIAIEDENVRLAVMDTCVMLSELLEEEDNG